MTAWGRLAAPLARHVVINLSCGGAGAFTGPTALARAVSLGFADEVASPDTAFSALLRFL